VPREVKAAAEGAILSQLGSVPLGARVSLARARRSLQLRLNPPTALGAPDAVYERLLESGVDITLLYEPRTVGARIGARERVLVSVVRGTLAKQFIGKTVGQATDVEQFAIDDGEALLLTGKPHLVIFFRRRDGIGSVETRLAGTTLLWQRKAMLIRIEGSLPKARLVEIARSLTTG
jgi:hypothetical protein